jgi:hypothetical protein
MKGSHSIASRLAELSRSDFKRRVDRRQKSHLGRSDALDTTSTLDDHRFKPIWRIIMDVGDWLRSLGLGQYETTFRDNGIDADVLCELTEADFEKLGVFLRHHGVVVFQIVIGGFDHRPHT